MDEREKEKVVDNLISTLEIVLLEIDRLELSICGVRLLEAIETIRLEGSPAQNPIADNEV